MSLKDTYKQMKELLANITLDLEKSENGNKAASQRVRTGTVKMEKVAKLFRKESISSEKKTKGQKKPAKSASASKGKGHADHKGKAAPAAKGKAASHAKAASHSKPAAASHAKSKAAPAAKAKPKAKAAQTSFKSRPLAVKRQTAKLPTRR